MFHSVKKVKTVALAVMLLSSAVSAQDFEAGTRAFDAGDYETAEKEWRPLAEQGIADAQYFLGLLYAAGLGVPHDDFEAAKWIRLAAEQGLVGAQADLGYMFALGVGIPQDFAESVKWLRLAAVQGDVEAQKNLGIAYLSGAGAPLGKQAAFMWYSVALKNGHERVGRLRDSLASNMTAQEISDAEERARVCLETDYRECD